MAGLTLKITAEQRPAMYQRKVLPHPETERVMVFMTFPVFGGEMVVEFEDGHCESVLADCLRFLDSKERFDEMCWDEP